MEQNIYKEKNYLKELQLWIAIDILTTKFLYIVKRQYFGLIEVILSEKSPTPPTIHFPTFLHHI